MRLLLIRVVESACRLGVAVCCLSTTLLFPNFAHAQRLLGLDVSAYQGNISTTSWATFKRPTTQQVGGVFGDGRDFVIIRSSRGGTSGEDHRQGGYPSGNNSLYYGSERYDDPYFVQNINRATAAGLFAGAYHFARPDVIVGTVNSDGSTVTVANTGTDEADHFIQMAGPWMRPGYLPPMLDLEAGQSQRTSDQMAQFSSTSRTAFTRSWVFALRFTSTAVTTSRCKTLRRRSEINSRSRPAISRV